MIKLIRLLIGAVVVTQRIDLINRIKRSLGMGYQTHAVFNTDLVDALMKMYPVSEEDLMDFLLRLDAKKQILKQRDLKEIRNEAITEKQNKETSKAPAIGVAIREARKR